jgi:DNA modification methylase
MMRVECGDCLLLLANLEQSSVDLILTDPPYNISRANQFQTMGRAGIDFGEWDKDADLLSWLSPAVSAIKPGGSLVVFNDWKNLGLIAEAAEQVGLETKDLLRLEKTNPMPRNRDRRYITDFELAVWFVKPGAKWVFNRQDPAYQRPKFVHSVDKGLHPTQKSLGLMEDLVRIHSNPGDLIVDPYAGSGTTGVAAKRLGRRFFGIEIDPDYAAQAARRIEEAG